MSAELEPCPFCGEAEKIIVPWTRIDAENTWWGVECHNCGAQVAPRNTKAEAIAAWNTRADEVGDDTYPDFTDAQWEKIKSAIPRPDGPRTPRYPVGMKKITVDIEDGVRRFAIDRIVDTIFTFRGHMVTLRIGCESIRMPMPEFLNLLHDLNAHVLDAARNRPLSVTV